MFDQLSRIPSTHDQEVTLNSRPIIGILSHPGDGANGRLDKDINNSYIAASYVRLVQSGGARVIPLVYNEKQDSFKNVRFHFILKPAFKLFIK